MMSRGHITLALVLCACAAPLPAQTIRKSQLATVSQQIADTHLEILYRRPVARGRTLFGTLVPWGRIWSPSADSAARITVSTDVAINGAKLAAGTYGIWAIPDSTEWTIIFNSDAVAFHLRYPVGRDALRVQARPLKGDHVESLLFSVPMVDADSATLQLHWGTTIVPLVIRAPSPGGAR
jgi:hypothetical protein